MRDADSGRLSTNLLLNRADDLGDPMPLTCLESAFPGDVAKDADQDDLLSGVFGATVTLSRLASITERHPRAFLFHGFLRDVIAAATEGLTREIREEGIYESSWDVPLKGPAADAARPPRPSSTPATPTHSEPLRYPRRFHASTRAAGRGWC
ncbi:hypothetical protein [Streptomyces viridosporus]|uniref:hypothetical protein n=1 Tax=Streptomyces viridosporus TaxID=67581 RepID=UPI0036F5AA90